MSHQKLIHSQQWPQAGVTNTLGARRTDVPQQHAVEAARDVELPAVSWKNLHHWKVSIGLILATVASLGFLNNKSSPIVETVLHALYSLSLICWAIAYI